MVAFNDPAPRSPTRFPLGQTCGTPAALQALAEAGQAIDDLLRRHQAGDWGEIGDEDCQENELGLSDEGRLMSVYKLATGTTVWVITEADRSVTTVLLPDDY